MKKNLFLLLFSALVFSSCDNYGKKIKVSDTVEVYIKGDSVTDADARKFGSYIDSTWKTLKNEKSFQLSKDSGQFVVRMVVDEKRIKADTTLDASFMALQFLFEDQVFKGKKVKLILTDDHFKDVKTFYHTDTNIYNAADTSLKK